LEMTPGGGEVGGLRSHEWKTSYSDEDDPLRTFLIPALERSVRYDRAAGFFSSSVLSIAARGISRLIRNGGRMRLITSVRLSKDDVEALKRGFSEKEVVQEAIRREALEPADLMTRRRLEALAWLAATGKLEVRVAVPSVEGRIQPAETEIFHSKVGVFTDARGNQISFSGSINETGNAWTGNIEHFQVFTSWGIDPSYHRDNVKYFERLWADAHSRARVFDLTEAVKKKLISYVPAEAPKIEPEEAEKLPPTPAEGDLILIQFLKDAPLLPNGHFLADAFVPFRPRPHQLAVANAIVENYPRRFLLADEVGLGKTIETGIALERLLLSGKVSRCLILTPASIRRQWQEQLRDKFGLNFWRYEGDEFIDAYGERMVPRQEAGNPLDQVDLVIMSAQLAARRSRREEVLTARPWDVVTLDEAHHARRSVLLSFDPKKSRGDPNLLLQLMRELESRTVGLLLLTATPMQLNLVELFDLLNLLGVKGRWATDDEAFVTYFQALASGDPLLGGTSIFEMARDYTMDMSDFDEFVRNRLGPASYTRIKLVLTSPNPLNELKKLSEEERLFLCQYLRRTTPLQSLMFRHTRQLLKDYRRRGLVQDTFPERRVDDRFIELSPDERKLYEEIEEYITGFYRKAEDRHALILRLVLQVLRRRLTSSIAAIRRTLVNRLKALSSEAGGTGLDEEEDLEEIGEDLEETEADRELKGEEEAYLKDLVGRLEGFTTDSKLKQFLSDLSQILQKHERVLVFTQYTDTMNYIRDHMAQIYGSVVACYSGRGGEVYEGGRWRPVPREEVERGLRGPIKIMVGTDAMGEGLDLQSASVVINYDMPWNPMRVEQRIGRVDRIGQTSPKVDVINYFYRDTIEARIYQVLNERHQLFTEVVGEAPQILARISRLIEEGIAQPPERREEWLREKKKELLEEYEELRRNRLIDEEMARRGKLPVPEGSPPLTPQELEGFLLSCPLTRDKFSKIREKVYRFSADGLSEYKVTFDIDAAEKGDAEFFSYNSPRMGLLLKSITSPAGGRNAIPHIVRVSAAAPNGRAAVGYFCRPSSSGVVEISTFKQLREIVGGGVDSLIPLSEADIAEVRGRVQERLRGELTREEELLKERRRMRIENARLRCRGILDRIVAIAMRLEPVEEGLLLEGVRDEPSQTQVSMKLKELIRDKKYYVPALFKVVSVDLKTYSVPEYVFRAYEGKRYDSLTGELGSLKQAAKRALETYKQWVNEAEDTRPKEVATTVHVIA